MKKTLYFMIAFVAAVLTACSETHEEETEFANWQERNDAFFSTIYAKAVAESDNGSKSWKVIKAFSKNNSSNAITSNPTDYIVVEVLKNGDSNSRPTLATDSASVHYRGNLMPTESYAAGYQFDTSWIGDYNLAAMTPSRFKVGDLVTGFSTALMNMNLGDRWKVYIPYELGYGTTEKTGIPAYSTLIFDITLVNSWPKRIDK